jgi:hypothetical protein
MLMVTTTKGKPSHLAVSQVGKRTDDAEGVFDSKLWQFEGVRRTSVVVRDNRIRSDLGEASGRR